MRYRFIPPQAFSAHMNMALDEAICESVKRGTSLPTIRLYTWKPSAISIGYFQGLKDEVDLKTCREQGVDWVRRRTGGGAVYHDSEGEITYSLIGPEEHFPKEIIKSYEQICQPLISALESIGIRGHFSPINDIMVGERKISGNAQTRRQGILLQHGTILHDVDVDKMFSLLKVGKEKIADKLIQSVKKRVTRVLDHSDASREDLAKALAEAFGAGREIETGDYTAEELGRARQLVEERYSTDSWNEMR